jgi:hypothetical protein
MLPRSRRRGNSPWWFSPRLFEQPLVQFGERGGVTLTIIFNAFGQNFYADRASVFLLFHQKSPSPNARMARVSNHQRSFILSAVRDDYRFISSFTTRNYHLQCARCQNSLLASAINQ